jgi:predicted PurR-regulated permease PerM
MYLNLPYVAESLAGKTMKGWFKAVFSMAFYIGLFSGIGYLIQRTLF